MFYVNTAELSIARDVVSLTSDVTKSVNLGVTFHPY